jgi:hypothetical protein
MTTTGEEQIDERMGRRLAWLEKIGHLLEHGVYGRDFLADVGRPAELIEALGVTDLADVERLADGHECWPDDAGVLSVTKHTTYDIALSCGGPADGFRLTVDEDGDPLRLEYYFHDWFDGAARTVKGDAFDLNEPLRYIAGLA